MSCGMRGRIKKKTGPDLFFDRARGPQAGRTRGFKIPKIRRPGMKNHENRELQKHLENHFLCIFCWQKLGLVMENPWEIVFRKMWFVGFWGMGRAPQAGRIRGFKIPKIRRPGMKNHENQKSGKHLQNHFFWILVLKKCFCQKSFRKVIVLLLTVIS